MFEIGFLPIRVWDILDILIAGYLLYWMYKLVKGSIAFNIFIGLLILYVSWWLVGILKMELLSGLLSQFVSVGVIILIIIFQPEVRRFLLLLGNTTLKSRSNFLGKLLDRNSEEFEDREAHVVAIKKALVKLSKNKTGALMILGSGLDIAGLSQSGTLIDAQISQPLIESIFHKESPLHDGAVLVTNGQIARASVILPVSNSQTIPKNCGLRHRAAVGVTENADVGAFIVSEETGKISYAHQGILTVGITEEVLMQQLTEHYKR